MAVLQQVFLDLGLTLIERGWLSSNNVVFASSRRAPATVVDTGYGSHVMQTDALLRQVLDGESLGRIVNTHLHSDHCGGNARLASRFGATVCVPEASFETARRWDVDALSFQQTGQRCDRFTVDGAIVSGDVLDLGPARWRVIPTAGHDPDGVMLFEPTSGVLMTADALWEDRLAIVFPEIDGDAGFSGARATLDVIEQLQPKIVIPGHGRAFCNVAQALQASRLRLALFEREPERHLRYATRALTMFHMLEVQCQPRGELLAWLLATPIFARLHARGSRQQLPIGEFAAEVVGQLLCDGLLTQDLAEAVSVR